MRHVLRAPRMIGDALALIMLKYSTVPLLQGKQNFFKDGKPFKIALQVSNFLLLSRVCYCQTTDHGILIASSPRHCIPVISWGFVCAQQILDIPKRETSVSWSYRVTLRQFGVKSRKDLRGCLPTLGSCENENQKIIEA